MSHINELEDFVNGLVSPVKVAESDFDMLSLSELETLMGIDLSQDDEKVAYLSACVDASGGGDRYKSWLDQFAGTPLHAKAIQLCEQELALEQDRLQKRIARDQELDDERETWTKQDMLRLQKDMLQLELHKSKMGQGGGKDPTKQAEPAEPEPEKKSSLKEAVSKAWIIKMVRSGGAKASPQRLDQFIDRSFKKEVQLPRSLQGYKAQQKRMTARHEAALALMDKEKKSSVQMTGQVNNGDPSHPEWPRAALGADSAGRRATPEEERAQAQTGGDGAFRQPEKGSKIARLMEAVKRAGTAATLKKLVGGRPPPIPVSAVKTTPAGLAAAKGAIAQRPGMMRVSDLKPNVTRHAPMTPGGMAAKARREADLSALEQRLGAS